jgi:hypothetical protein
MAETLDRRRFLGGTMALAGAVLVGGCREEPDPTAERDRPAAGGPNAGDLDLAVALGQIEQTLGEAFATLASARADDLVAAGLAERNAHHGALHREHADVLAGVLAETGADLVALTRTFPGMAVPTERDLTDLPVDGLLGILARCEAAAAATCADAVGRITLPDLRGIVAGLGAADAGLAQALQLAIGGGLASLDQSDLVDGLLPLDRSYLTG